MWDHFIVIATVGVIANRRHAQDIMPELLSDAFAGILKALDTVKGFRHTSFCDIVD